MSPEARPLLFSPLRIGPVTAPNRIVWGAHFTQFVQPASTVGEPGYYGARYGRYLGERAAGGAGVVIAGQAQAHPTTAYQMRNNAIAWGGTARRGRAAGRRAAGWRARRATRPPRPPPPRPRPRSRRASRTPASSTSCT